MKKIYFPVIAFIFFVFLVTGLLSSCKKDGFLGQTVTNNLDEETVFSDSANSVGFLTGIYTNVGVSYSVNRFGNGGLDAASDESELSSTDLTTASQFATGTINAGIVSGDVYTGCYRSIRASNILLKNLSSKSNISDNRVTLMKAEARFLRAWYYSLLLKHYGGVPLIGDTVYSFTDRIPAARNPYAEVVDYIVSECDAAAQALPIVQVGLNYGRASRGSCMALKARVLLYAASPQFNDPAPNAGERTSLTLALAGGNAQQLAPLVGYTDYSADRWRLAAEAAKELMNTGAYSLFYDTTTAVNKSRPGLGFQSVFRNRVNVEYVFTLMRGENSELEDLFMVPSRGGNRRGAFPYQELVDAFPMRNGRMITDPASGYNPQDPYKNRDPRLDFSVIRDQTRVAIRQFPAPSPALSPVSLYTNNPSPSGDEAKRGTPTGYYRYKMLDSLVPGTYSIVTVSKRSLPMIRYAEVLLNFAEAQNEYLSAPSSEVYDAVEAVRKRAGLNPYQLPTGLSKDEMREIIHNERRIELAFEEHRFWDVRRWKQAKATFSKMMSGMEVTRAGGSPTGTATYTRYNVRKHDFQDAMYLWPFPQVETGKSPELIQNPGYL
ncbi:MAG: RagB/SusD family nutrient uptake outer membrane protein [Sphingobacteriaceae bacterium]|nr:MAG: RagB/SusD family nutrient uptake outer membrane protein [Sphingobacteriaceae bacterium]